MNTRERVLAAFGHQKTDKVPVHHIGFSPIEVAKSVGGMIVGTSNYFVPGTSIDNVLTLLQTIRENR